MWALLLLPAASAFLGPRRPRCHQPMAATVTPEPGVVFAATPPPRLPPPLVSDVPGTWAHDTMSRRVLEEILQRTLDENAGEEALAAAAPALEALRSELVAAATTALSHMPDDGGPDHAEWRATLAPLVDARATWLSAPWLVTEFYLYRRMIGAFGFWSTRYDPFKRSKAAGLESARGSIEALAARANAACGTTPAADDCASFDRLFVSVALWGNRMDLSIWPAGTDAASAGGGDAFGAVLDKSAENLLADDSEALLARVLAPARAAGGRVVDVVVDNAGFELVTDLALADWLVSSGAASRVVFRLKGHPTFVSDALAKDVLETVDFLEAGGAGPAGAETAARWRGHLDGGRWALEEDVYWAQPFPFWEMPNRVSAALAGSALVVLKGDANYRRLLGDRHWPLDTLFATVGGACAAQHGAPLLALRTLKAELGVGIPPEQSARAAAANDNWMVSGKYGVVHFHDPRAA